MQKKKKNAFRIKVVGFVTPTSLFFILSQKQLLKHVCVFEVLSLIENCTNVKKKHPGFHYTRHTARGPFVPHRQKPRFLMYDMLFLPLGKILCVELIKTFPVLVMVINRLTSVA